MPVVLIDTAHGRANGNGGDRRVLSGGESYPLGPHLLEELEAIFGEDPNVILENFTWSPVHIVQRLQGGEMERPDRVILVGLAADTNKPGTVSAHRWIGGSQPEVMVQERIYEAVTGIVDLENTLMIGSYFKVWPTECLTVEVDLAADTFGRLVMAENGGRDSERIGARTWIFAHCCQETDGGGSQVAGIERNCGEGSGSKRQGRRYAVANSFLFRNACS